MQVGPAAVVAVEPVVPVEAVAPVDAVELVVVVVLVDVVVPGATAPVVLAAESDPPPLPQAAICAAINTAAIHVKNRRIFLRINVFPS